MIDILLQYEDDEDAMVAMSAHGYVIDGAWNDTVTPDVSVLYRDGTQGEGYWITITLPERDEAIEDQATLVLDRRLGGDQLSDYVIVSPLSDEAVDNIVEVMPPWPDSDYPMGARLS